MNKKSFIAIGLLVAMIGGGAVYVLANPAMEVSAPKNQDSARTEPTSMLSETDNSTVAGRYVDYSAEAVAATPGTKILFFHAPWCPQCRSLEESIKTTVLPDNVTIFKVDYDLNQALRQQYGVTLQTTFVKVNDEGEKTDSYVAYDEPVFASVERELLR